MILLRLIGRSVHRSLKLMLVLHHVASRESLVIFFGLLGLSLWSCVYWSWTFAVCIGPGLVLALSHDMNHD